MLHFILTLYIMFSKHIKINIPDGMQLRNNITGIRICRHMLFNVLGLHWKWCTSGAPVAYQWRISGVVCSELVVNYSKYQTYMES